MILDPTVHPAEDDPKVNKEYSRYMNILPDNVPSDVVASVKAKPWQTTQPVDPEIWKNNFMTVYTSAAHTYGNVLSAVEQYVLDLFPAGLFKAVHTSMSTSNRQLRSTPSQLIKNRFPMMVTKARIDYGQDGNRFLGYTLLTDRMGPQQLGWGMTNLQPMIMDRKYGYRLDWFLNKWVMNIDFILVFNTLPEQINWNNYLQNATQIAHPFLIVKPLETMMPHALLNEISYITGIPVYQKECVGPFLQYLNSVSQDPITYKLKGGSGNDEFFRYSMESLDLTISPPETDEGTRSSQTTRLYEITFSIRVEFNGVGYFFLSSPKIRYKSDKPIFPDKDDTSVVCHYTDDLNYRLIDVPPGWSILSTPSLKFSSYDDNVVSFRPIIDEKIDAMISFFLAHGMDPSLFLSFEFRNRSHVIQLHNPWRIDWKKRAIIMEEPDLWQQYRMIVLVNQSLINNYQKASWGLK